MNIDDIETLRQQHSAWRLLRASSAPLVLSFLGDFFIEDNNGASPATVVIDALDDHLYEIHAVNPDAYVKAPVEYLDDWAAPERGWLRKFYPVHSEEVHYDATPAVERAYRWVQGLQQRSFVGTESRLHTLIELLRQIVHGSETDPEARIAELTRRREEIDAEIAQVEANEVTLMDETAIRERYHLFATTARELLSDFREVEENFRSLDRSARERIAGWDGSKGDLLAELVTSRTDITASDQGRSFAAFYDFLLSEQRQSELTGLLQQVLEMDTIDADRRLRYVHNDWAEAAERTQHTVRNLTEQLRRFLEDQVWIENRRVLDLVRGVEQLAITIRDSPPGADARVGLRISEPGLPIGLPFERPLYEPRTAAEVNSIIGPADEAGVELDALLAQQFVDTSRLRSNIRAVVPPRSVANLADVIALYPLRDGAAELLGYLSLGDGEISVDFEGETVGIDYLDAGGQMKTLRLTNPIVRRR